MPARNPRTADGRAALLHSIAHIEFNAIGLALDAIWRFAGLPPAYYLDWLQVAHEETHHFRLLTGHLATLGHAYGDFDAHDGLWDMAARTAGDVLDRMALVPRRLEARGLDVSPGIKSKLIAAGDPTAAAILDVILRDEIGHVAVGNRWFNWLCSVRGLDPVATDAHIALRHRVPRPRGPFNLAARRAAGFSAGRTRACLVGRRLLPQRYPLRTSLQPRSLPRGIGSHSRRRYSPWQYSEDDMNLASILNTPLSKLLGRRKPAPPRRLASAPKPRMGATLCCAGLRMTVQAGLTDEMWQWLVALGWRELRSRRKPPALPGPVDLAREPPVRCRSGRSAENSAAGDPRGDAPVSAK